MKFIDVVQCGDDGIGFGLSREEEVENRIGHFAIVVVVGLRAEKADIGQLHVDLFQKLAAERLLGGFADVDEAARDGEFALGRLLGAADEERLAVRAQGDRGGGDGRVEVEMKSAGGAVERGVGIAGGDLGAALGAELKFLRRKHGRRVNPKLELRNPK